jgi:RNA polymerase sigma-70 factor (ECF subfamily)
MSEVRYKASKTASHLAAVAFRQYSESLHAYLVRRLHRGSDIPNLAMEIYERFLRTRQIETVDNPQAYLFRIASHVVSDAHRLEGSRPVTYNSELADEAGERPDLAVPDDIGERLDAAQELQRVRKAIEQLPAMHQTVLWLAVHDGLAHKEIARRTGLAVTTVGLYVCEARARLRTLLGRS